MHWRKGELSKRSYRSSQSRVLTKYSVCVKYSLCLEYNYLSVSELKIQICTRMHLKSNAQAKGGLSKRSYRRSQSRVPGVAICLSSPWATAWKPDEIKNSRRAATAPARNAVKIPLLRRRGATHCSAQRRRLRCDTPRANSFADALHCSRGARRCGSRGVCHERRIVRTASWAFAACSIRSAWAKLSSLERALRAAMVMPSRSGAVLAVWAQSVLLCSRSVPNKYLGGAIRSVQPVC